MTVDSKPVNAAKREGQDGGRAGDEDVVGGEGGDGEAVGAALDQYAAGEQDEDAGLGDEQDAEELGAEVDGAVAAVRR